jgi:hypothetical protein
VCGVAGACPWVVENGGVVRWEDERYVRVYTRDTLDWLALGWEAHALFHQILRKVDRAGLLDLGRSGIGGIAIATGIPEEVVGRALAKLAADGCVVLKGSYLVVPNFIEAQEAKQSDKQRQREHREKARSVALSQNVTVEGAPVTKRDEMSRGLEGCHADLVSVTPSLAVPDPLCSLVASSPDPRATGGPILPTTSTRLIHCLKVAMEKARPTRGMYAPGPFSTRDADELLRSVGGEQAAEEIAKRIALFVADDTMTPWTVARFCKVYNGIGAPKPRLPGQRNPAQY